MTLKDFIDGLTARFCALYSQPEAKALAFRVVEHFYDIPSYKFISEPGCSIDESKSAEAVEQLAKGRPLQYVLGFSEFCGHKFKVREGCLIPRPETEELVSRIIDDVSGTELTDEPYNILDICTGSGCIAYSLAAEFPEAMVYGCDNSNDALAIACKQRVKLQGARPIIFYADLMQDPPVGLPQFDLIVSNPPYVLEGEKSQMRCNVLAYEPSQALFVPDDDPLVFYRRISLWAKRLLKPQGCVWLEINERFGAEVSALFPGSQVLQDIFGKDRFVVLKK